MFGVVGFWLCLASGVVGFVCGCCVLVVGWYFRFLWVCCSMDLVQVSFWLGICLCGGLGFRSRCHAFRFWVFGISWLGLGWLDGFAFSWYFNFLCLARCFL